LGYLGLPWATLGYLGLPWATLGYLGLPWATLGYFGLPWATLATLGLLTQKCVQNFLDTLEHVDSENIKCKIGPWPTAICNVESTHSLNHGS
jgi:hypothetical protein